MLYQRRKAAIRLLQVFADNRQSYTKETMWPFARQVLLKLWSAEWYWSATDW